ncbi:dihydroneopterin aldolase [Jannaschia sp. LMIT008]|uniref:dihydroneopterin aldolase n=1 Tax=Jannaschia maritima TaxID=3032585 RepID=UPI002810FD9C|nr:dihydroneopterin aldolase [Jannaschia sp. LMIT008]
MDRDDSFRGAPFGDARASAMPRDRITLRDHVREVEIGAFQEERGRRQRLRFDIAAEVTPDPGAAASDDVDGILSYDALVDAIDAELAAGRLNLLEALAERIAARILRHGRAALVFVRIEKLDRGPHALGVEIVRRSGTAGPDDGERIDGLRVVVHDDAVADLSAWLDDATTHGPTVILAAPGDARPRTGIAQAQRRIDLLATEIAAWRLAAQDPRCIVADTRTELVHLLRGAGLAVWAPSRLVLDAVDPPAAVDPRSLAAWLSDRLGAS